MIPADLLALLRCPLTRQPLSVAGADLLAEVNGRRPDRLDAALVRADGAVLYPVVDGIPVLLADQAISIQAATC